MSGEAKELSWEANGLHIAGLAWGDPDAPPMLALHGWLDNAASFARLAPLLDDYYIVALDLTGHGLSDKRSADATYQIWDDLPQIASVLDQLGWDSFHLMGHSRGAVIASLLAAAMPERVRRLVMLDAVGPYPQGEADAAGQLRKFIDDRERLLQRVPRVYDTLEEAIAVRQDQDKMPREAAEIISRRNLRAAPDGYGYSWTTDARLRGASAVKFTRPQVDSLWQALTMPSLLLLADPGQGIPGMERWAKAAAEGIPGLLTEVIEGGHHFHMEASAPLIAGCIRKFLQESGS